MVGLDARVEARESRDLRFGDATVSRGIGQRQGRKDFRDAAGDAPVGAEERGCALDLDVHRRHGATGAQELRCEQHFDARSPVPRLRGPQLFRDRAQACGDFAGVTGDRRQRQSGIPQDRGGFPPAAPASSASNISTNRPIGSDGSSKTVALMVFEFGASEGVTGSLVEDGRNRDIR